MRNKPANADAAVARIAARQHGVVALAQLVEAGLSRPAVSRRVAGGRLHRLHRGVYAVGHRSVSPQGRWLAAVLACGGRSVLSHASAAALWNLLPAASVPVHVTVAGGGCRARAGVVVHRTKTLELREVIRRDGIPVTTPARTLSDLRRVLPRQRLSNLIRRAEALELDVGGLSAEPTRSELERMFLRLCRRHRLPPPEVNVRAGSFEVDFLWRDERLVVETDGYRHHGGRAAFETDRARDARLKQMGLEVLRFTYRQVRDEPARVAAIVEAVRARRG